jgi:hypothetical protein
MTKKFVLGIGVVTIEKDYLNWYFHTYTINIHASLYHKLDDLFASFACSNVLIFFFFLKKRRSNIKFSVVTKKIMEVNFVFTIIKQR